MSIFGYAPLLMAGLPASTLLNGLAAYYTLDSNSNDSLGVTNGADTAISYVAGKVGNAAQGNGSTSVIVLGNGPALVAPTFAVSFWVKPVDLSTYWFFVTKNNGPSTGWEIRLFSGTGQIEFVYSGGSWLRTLSTPMVVGVWTHVVLNVTPSLGNGMQFFINGTLDIQGNSGPFTYSPTDTMYIGTRSDGYTHFNFLMDEVGYWNRALTPAEVTALYNGGSGKTYPF